MCYLALPGLAHVSSQKNVNRAAAALPWGEGKDFKSRNKVRQRQETLFLSPSSWYLQEDGFSSGALGGGVPAVTGP